MNLYTQPDKDAGLCMLYSFAMCLEVPPEELSKEVGTSTHWREFVDPCLKRGFIPLFLNVFPTTVATPQGEAIWPLQACYDNITCHLLGRRAVLLTTSHAVGYDSGIIYDSALPKTPTTRNMYPADLCAYRDAIVLIKS